MTYRVTSLHLATQVEHDIGNPSSTLQAAVKKARSRVEGGLLRGPENETRVYKGESPTPLHRFRKLTHGSLSARGGSFRARPCEVDENGNPGTTVRLFGKAVGPEVGSDLARDMLGHAVDQVAKGEQ